MNSILYILILWTSDIPKYTTANSITCKAKIKGKNIPMDLCINYIGTIFVQIHKNHILFKNIPLSVYIPMNYQEVFFSILTIHILTLYPLLRFIIPNIKLQVWNEIFFIYVCFTSCNHIKVISLNDYILKIAG